MPWKSKDTIYVLGVTGLSASAILIAMQGTSWTGVAIGSSVGLSSALGSWWRGQS